MGYRHHSTRISLEQIKITEPCHESWDAMTGDEQRRFCDSCSKHVHDLSKLSREEAEALVNCGESVCVRMQRTPKGIVLTKSRFDRPTSWFRAAAAVATMLGITSLFQSGCKPADKTIQGRPLPPETPNVRTMGIVAMPERQPSSEMGEIAPATQPVMMGKVAPPLPQQDDVGDDLLLPADAAPTTNPATPQVGKPSP